MQGQKGVTLTGMLVVSVVVILLLLLGFKILPVYLEYFAIEKHFKAMAADQRLRGASRRAIEAAWAARASVDDLRSMDPQLIDISKQGDEVIVSAEYSVKVPLIRNVAACFDFKPTSK
jgi:hypothetical protein